MTPKLPQVSDQPVGQREMAVLLGLHVRHVNRLVDEGMPTVNKSGRRLYPAPECIAWYLARKLEQQAPKEKVDRSEFMNRKLEAEAGMAELSLEKQRGSLVPIDYLDQQVSAVLLQMRSALRNMPGVFSPRLVGLKDVTAVQLVLQGIVDEMLTTLSQAGESEELDEEAEGPALELV